MLVCIDDKKNLSPKSALIVYYLFPFKVCVSEGLQSSV